MNHDELQRALMETEEIAPSSGFVGAVMEAVRREAAATAPIPFPPIPFPWKWALPGLIVCVALGAGMTVRWIYSVASVSHPTDSAPLPPIGNFWAMLPHLQISSSTLVATEWSALGALVSLVAVWLSMRIARVRE